MNCRHCGGEITVHDADYGKVDECRDCAKDVDKYVGHMVWDHKTAPALEIHANAKSLHALKNGKYNEGLSLKLEVKERARRRESDICSEKMSYSPYVRKEMEIDGNCEELPKLDLRAGSGKTVVTFGKSILEKFSSGDRSALRHLSGEKLQLAKAASKILMQKISGSSVTIWKDEQGFYIIPKKQDRIFKTDMDTILSLGYRTANYIKF